MICRKLSSCVDFFLLFFFSVSFIFSRFFSLTLIFVANGVRLTLPWKRSTCCVLGNSSFIYGMLWCAVNFMYYNSRYYMLSMENIFLDLKDGKKGIQHG